MAFINLGGLSIDTEDIDLLVNYCPLADLDAAIEADKLVLSQFSLDDKLRPYFEHRLKTHEIALDIAERTWNEGIRVCQRIDPPIYSITKSIIKTYKKQPPKKARKYEGIEL